MGSPRDLGRESKKPEEAPQKTDLMSRVADLRIQQRKGWEEISGIIKAEGLGGAGESLTANALRKRFNRSKESKRSSQVPQDSHVVTEPTTPSVPSSPSVDHVQEQLLGEVGTLRSEMSFITERLAAIDSAVSLVPEKGIAVPMQELVSLNNQLMDRVLESHRIIERLEKQIEEQAAQTDHTGIDAEEHTVTSRDLLELLKEITAGREKMEFVEEKKHYRMSREEVQNLIEESVQDRVDTELKTMLSAQGGFSAELTRLIDQRLNSLFSRGEPVAQTPHAGPGRGKRGKTHKKFSASLEQSLFIRVKSLPGQFSAHLANALEAYLAVVEEKHE